ncbi:hypothetical protein [Streptomyces sp. NPDC058861]|uniref:hypothetical protein n=1 Tax=Streptomyces sp. NPDC058861 TaxID=3346653 RepID=UPI0036B5EEF8
MSLRTNNGAPRASSTTSPRAPSRTRARARPQRPRRQPASERRPAPGDAVALVCHAPADRYGRLLLDKDSLDRLDRLDRLDHHDRPPLLARGPEGHAETVTVLSLEHAL